MGKTLGKIKNRYKVLCDGNALMGAENSLWGNPLIAQQALCSAILI